MTIQQMIKLLKDAVRRIEALEQAQQAATKPVEIPAELEPVVRRGRPRKVEVTEPEPVVTESVATEPKSEI